MLLLYLFVFSFADAKMRHSLSRQRPTFLYTTINLEINDLLRTIMMQDNTKFSKPNVESQFQTSIFLTLGNFCVYHSECSGCNVGYSQRCIANRCQCLPGMTHVASINAKPKMTTTDCVLKISSNPTLVYFDYGNQECITEKPKKATITNNCPSNIFHNMTSIVDREKYCLNAIDMIDMICYDNKMCQDALDTDMFVGLCYNGLCHVMSVVNLKAYIISEPSCNLDVTTHCEEADHKHLTITYDRIVKCKEECKRKNTKGIPSKASDKCFCFFPKVRVLNKLVKTLNTF